MEKITAEVATRGCRNGSGSDNGRVGVTAHEVPGWAAGSELLSPTASHDYGLSSGPQWHPPRQVDSGFRYEAHLVIRQDDRIAAAQCSRNRDATVLRLAEICNHEAAMLGEGGNPPNPCCEVADTCAATSSLDSRGIGAVPTYGRQV
jgi:hypothetical protein